MSEPSDSLSRFKTFRILQVNSGDRGSGAGKVCWNLFNAYRRLGYPSYLAVGQKDTSDPDVRELPRVDLDTAWARLWIRMSESLQPVEAKLRRGAGPLRRMLHEFATPAHVLNDWQGIEDFDFPGSWKLLDLWPERPALVHCHTLHIGYFDLRVLPWLSRQLPVVLTLHDAWHLSGHCAHSLDCERWKTGCGHCPDLTLHPRVLRDETAYNWRRKQEIYGESRLFVATPSKWLMRKVEQSMLASGAVELRVIPNGVDLSVFRPGDREIARKQLDLPLEANIMLFVTPWGRAHDKHGYKDYPTMRGAAALVAERLGGKPLLFLTVGETAPREFAGRAELRFVPLQEDPSLVARYYQAADIYVHATTAETSSLAVAEAMACGSAVVATDVGGIPELVEDGRTGRLVPLGDEMTMATRIEELLLDESKLRAMGRNAAETARRRFDLNHQVSAYLQWYSEILESWRSGASETGKGAHQWESIAVAQRSTQD